MANDNTIRARFAILLVVLVFVFTTGLTTPDNQLQSSPLLRVFSQQEEINGDEVEVGDIIAIGVRGEDGTCDFDTIEVRTTAPGQNETQWLGIILDPRCQAVVNAKWSGSVDNGPQEIVNPLMELLPTASQLILEKSHTDTQNEGGASVAGDRATKTSEQHVFMYGYGGTWDKLTHKYGKITFSYNGQSATIISQTGSCQGSKPFSWYEWVVDGCYLTSVNYGPSTVVWRTGRGNYHCDPSGSFPCNLSNPDGYYHSLYDDEDGHASGKSYCTFWWSGNIVAGARKQILQGCN